MCPWSGNIPQPTNQLNNSQPQILQNFQAIEALVSINHFDFGTANVGKHTQVTLPENVAPINTAIDEANIYSRLSALTAQTELVWQRENNGTRIEWTGLLAAQNGWTRLPSGILLKWGLVATVGGIGPTTVVFPVAATIPVFNVAIPNNPFTVLLTGTRTAGGDSTYAAIVPGSVTNLQFQGNTLVPNIIGGGGAISVASMYYLAIGI